MRGLAAFSVEIWEWGVKDGFSRAGMSFKAASVVADKLALLLQIFWIDASEPFNRQT